MASRVKRGNGVRLILVKLESLRFEYALSFGILALKNEAKYKALIRRIELALQIGGRKTSSA